MINFSVPIRALRHRIAGIGGNAGISADRHNA
jgi:hypothetical protein